MDEHEEVIIDSIYNNKTTIFVNKKLQKNSKLKRNVSTTYDF